MSEKTKANVTMMVIVTLGCLVALAGYDMYQAKKAEKLEAGEEQ